MTSRLEKERTKQIQDKCQNLLSQMLRDEDNKYCVDCDAKGPRWASWNLGIFLCIRCAGIHRKLGVHISKVKSVNLDTWTPEQVVSLQQMGNSRARAVYEANLPDRFRRPQTDCSLESFIRMKYEHKKYIAREWVPPPLPKVNWDKELDEEAERQRRRKKEGSKSSSGQSVLPPVKKPEVVPQLPKPRSSISPKPSRANNSATLDLLGLDAPESQTSANTSGSSDDIFSSFLSAPPASASPAANGAANGITNTTSMAGKTEEESFFNQPAPTPQEKSKMTKDSILALYGTPSQQQQVFGVPGGMYTQQSTPQQFTQQLPGMAAFGHQNCFPSQSNSISQLNHPLQTQMGMPVAPQMPVNPGQISVNHVQLGAMPANPLGNNIGMPQINQINGLPNVSLGMPSQLTVTNAGPQMIQLGQSNVGSNNGWSGMLTAQNLQPAPGSNPFFNLAIQQQQQQQNTAFASQLPQHMSQLSLGGMAGFTSAPGKSASTALPGQTLSTNLWQ
ncbi:stromal membrane-associated protein 1 isoform X2 [Cephus cinctus]|uniref:Stromal membrane-associated protein 1 isoform X2 n=1 Tax=Cephus cinctus TaxID=211228 RepID=A0AAJ7BNK3_CEPCN|nr:stromal membrane-associated protein 1 isoform X2 [Cephus cinctus]